MRLYEFSKQVGISSKELLVFLRSAGFGLKSHMSLLTDEARAALEKKFKKGATPSAVVKAAEKPRISSRDDDREPVPAAEKALEGKPVPEKTVAPSAPEPAEPPFVVREMSVDDLARELSVPMTEVILLLLRKGLMVTKNQLLSKKEVFDVVAQYGFNPVLPKKSERAVSKDKLLHKGTELQERLPVVVVAGHVDHGKTTLLDYIRKSRVVAREKGGITQHLGAYHVKTRHGGIVFIDTPGHEAFTQVRLRGAKAADIMVLVVAADDSVKPQTIEALRHAQAMGVTVLVAVNKIDKVDPQRVDVVKRDLAQYGLLPEEWGGETIYVPISAIEGTGIDHLLEMIILQAQMLELKADSSVPAQGFILESKLQKGRGSVATVICQQGTVRVGDFFICGKTQGKVITLTDSYGSKVRKAGPSIPVLVTGFEALPDVGEAFYVVPEKDYRAARASKRDRQVSVLPKKTSELKALNIIIKAEGNASREALLNAIRHLSKEGEKELYIVHSAVGDINESDVVLAANTDAMIIGFNVKAESNAATAAGRYGITIQQYDVIYHVLDALRELLARSKEAVMVKHRIGVVEVRKVFDIKGLGVIAGCYVKEGKVTRDSSVVIWREQYKVGEGKIKSLQRDKRPMKEISAGYECAFLVDGFNEWLVGDRVECFREVPQE